MRNTRLLFKSVFAGLFLMAVFAANAADIEAGRVVSTQCALCHGPEGEGNGLPKSCLSCLDVATFLKHIHAYQTGTRKNYMMEKYAKNLSDKDVKNLVAYYAAKEGQEGH
jgi:cytochrome c553